MLPFAGRQRTVLATTLPWQLPDELPALAHALQVHTASLPPAAAFAVETAVLSGWCQTHRLPLSSALALLLGVTARSHSLSRCALLNAQDPRLLATAAGLRAAGTACFKVKVGGDGLLEQELSRLVALRQQLGANVCLRIDANQGWRPFQWSVALPTLSNLALQWVEEPWPWQGWRDVPDPGVPIALDESLQGEQGMQRLHWAIDQAWLRAVIIKPSCLGLLHSLAMIRLALAHQRQVCISHCWESAEVAEVLASLAQCLPGDIAHGLP